MEQTAHHPSRCRREMGLCFFATSPPTHPKHFHLALAYFQILKFSITTKRQSKSSTRAHFLRFPLCLSLLHARAFLSFFFPLKAHGHVTVLCLQGGGDCIQANGKSNGGGAQASTTNTNTNQTTATTTSNDSLTMTEHQVAKLMEEDMGSAMQYLQGKGLCLMPISLATAISTATCPTRNVNVNPLINAAAGATHFPTAANPAGEGPSSPSMSVLTVQSAIAGNDGAASVSKP